MSCANWCRCYYSDYFVVNQVDIWKLILAERKRQDEKWGRMPRNIRDADWLGILMEEIGEVSKNLNKYRDGDELEYLGTGEYRSMNETELTHCAAVIVSWLEDRF